MLYPEKIIDDELKVIRFMNTMTTEDCATQIMLRFAREGYKFMPNDVSDEALAKAGISKRQYIQLYMALR